MMVNNMAELKIKLNDYLNKLKVLPKCNKEDLYKWADYVELKCLANKDNFYSSNDFIDDARPRTEDLGEGDFEDTEKDKIEGTSRAQKNDKWETLAKETFKIIAFRQSVFGVYYPFTISANNLSIELEDTLTTKNKIYLFLLFSSSLQYTIKFKKEFTSSFEIFSKQVLEKYLPNNALIKVFGSSNTDDDDDIVTDSKFWDKLKFLEEFLNEKLIIEEEDISKYNKGDGGLDIVAKVSMGDSNSHFPIIFGQCACSPNEWIVKQSTIKADIWRQKITLKTIPQYYIFIPQSYRDMSGHWFDKTKIHETIIIDRQRLVMGYKNEKKFEEYSSYSIIEELINIKEEVI